MEINLYFMIDLLLYVSFMHRSNKSLMHILVNNAKLKKYIAFFLGIWYACPNNKEILFQNDTKCYKMLQFCF